jgi:hypothetical protein
MHVHNNGMTIHSAASGRIAFAWVHLHGLAIGGDAGELWMRDADPDSALGMLEAGC